MALKEHLLGRLARALSRRGSILCLHGVREDDDPFPSVMNVTVARLTELLSVVRAFGTIVSLEELHGRWAAGDSTRGMVAVTFDDAYYSLLATASRWYAQDPFPMTVFVVSAASELGAVYWWDRLEALQGHLSDEEWADLLAVATAGSAEKKQEDRADVAAHALRDCVVFHCHGRSPSGLDEELTRLEDRHAVRTRQRAMSIPELRRLGGLGPVTFGVHTATHPALPTLDRAEARREIRGAWDAMRSWGLPNVIPYLAVPFGLMGPGIVALGLDTGMTASLALDDRCLGSPLAAAADHALSRLSLVQAVTPMRLAHRLSGVRDILQPPGRARDAFLREAR